MSTNTEQLEKLNNSHHGWIQHEHHDNKTHYFITNKGDFYISACGKIFPDRDLMNRFDDNYKFTGSADDCCKRCISAYKKIKNGDLKEIKVQGIII